MKKSKNIRFIVVMLLIIIGVIITKGFFNEFEVTNYRIVDSMLPTEFEGFTIVQISDLEGEEIGTKQDELIRGVKNANPDLIVLTGDIIYKREDRLKNVEYLLNGIKNIAPIYSVTGNHELDNPLLYESLQALYNRYHVREINNENIQIVKGNASIMLCGIDYATSIDEVKRNDFYTQQTDDRYRILLCHDSNQYDDSKRYGFNLVLAGHTHGGIIRLPFIGGVLGNDGRFFPKYDGGVFEYNGNYLVSSRGLGNSIVPRFYNNPELVVVHLTKETK